MKRLSVVTISFNQSRFLRNCIDSVLAQKTPEVEYIVVDPGSTDGSREIISQYGDLIDRVVLEADSGPSDGLNNGFKQCSGEIFYYLNSDDEVLPGAFQDALAFLDENPRTDVVCGGAFIIDENGRKIRKLTSDPISRFRLAYGGTIVIQPATFFRRSAFEKSGGFNIDNRSNWDGELIVDLFLNGARIEIVKNIWGAYRLHPESITSTGRTYELLRKWDEHKRLRLGASNNPAIVEGLGFFFRLERLVREPWRVVDRIKGGRVFRRDG